MFYTWPLRITIPCTPTADPSTGSTCAVTTTIDAVIPGAVDEGERAVWGAQQLQVFDAGPDAEVASTDDNELFAVQGVFVP